MSLLLTRMGRRASWDRRFNPSFVLDPARGGLSDMVRGAAVSFSRASAAWAFDSSGLLRQYASGAPRIVPSPVGVMSVLSEPQSTNKCTNYNANPNGSLTNMTKGGDAAATLTEVDDTAALAAAGLSTVCSSGKVFKLDNSAGSSGAYVIVGGTAGNLNPHTVSCWARMTGTQSTGNNLGMSGGTVGNVQISSSTYVRYKVANLTPAVTGAGLAVVVVQGAVIYFTLNQLEEGAHETSPIVTAGAQVTRLRDNITAAVARFVPMSMYLDCYLVGQRSDQAQVLVNWDDGSSNRWSIYQDIVAGRPFCTLTSLAGVTQMQSVIGNSTTTQRHRVALAFAENDAAAVLDGGSAVTDSVCAAPAAATTLRLGESVGADNQSAFWIHGVRLYASRLTVAQLQALTS